MIYLTIGILLGMGLSYLVETLFPSAKGLSSLVIVGCIALGMMVKDWSDKKKAHKETIEHS